MALQSLRTLKELREECRSLGISVDFGDKKENKDSYIRALRNYYIQQKYPEGLPKGLELILNIESPMLCQRMQVLKESERDEVWNSKKWYLEEKLDGARGVMVKTDEGFDFYSRNSSVKDHLPISYKDTIYLGDYREDKIENEFILDMEIISTNPNIDTVMEKRGVITETKLQAVAALLALEPERSIAIQKEEAPLKFMAFDCLWFDGEWIMHKPLIERRRCLKKAIKQLKKSGIDISLPNSNISNKKVFYSSVLFKGGEGCVAKNIFSIYIPTSSRRRDAWVKVKRSMSESMQMYGIGDTIDAYITGYEEADESKGWAGLVGAIEVSVYLRDSEGNTKPHKIAVVSGIPMEDRKKMTALSSDGNPVLKREYYGKVVSVDGQAVSARAKRLKHAVLVSWRPDLSPDNCIIDEEFLNSMII